MGLGLLARVLTAKYCEHLPLYRQCVDLSRALLSNWVDACCRLMAPLDEALYRCASTSTGEEEDENRAHLDVCA